MTEQRRRTIRLRSTTVHNRSRVQNVCCLSHLHNAICTCVCACSDNCSILRSTIHVLDIIARTRTGFEGYSWVLVRVKIRVRVSGLVGMDRVWVGVRDWVKDWVILSACKSTHKDRNTRTCVCMCVSEWVWQREWVTWVGCTRWRMGCVLSCASVHVRLQSVQRAVWLRCV